METKQLLKVTGYQIWKKCGCLNNTIFDPPIIVTDIEKMRKALVKEWENLVAGEINVYINYISISYEEEKEIMYSNVKGDL